MTPEDSCSSTNVKLKLWPLRENEPRAWLVNEKFDIEYKGGKCALWGFSYAEKEMRWDDILILTRL